MGWKRAYRCNQSTGLPEMVNNLGPKGVPQSGINFAHLTVDISGEGTKKVTFKVTVKSGVAADVSVTKSGSASATGEVSGELPGGMQGKLGATFSLGTSFTWSGKAAKVHEANLEWSIECVCRDVKDNGSAASPGQ
jgi:hypothetical protein